MRTLFISLLVLVFFAAQPSFAALKQVGKGDKLTFDPSGIPPNLKTSWEIMKVKCIKCHTMERTVVAITTGVAPISGQPFDKSSTRAYGVKMMRKPDSNMDKKEIKASVDLMNWMLDQ